MKALVFGSLNLDYVYAVDHFVLPGETLSAKSQTVNPGGKGLNQSIALARAGAATFHAGCVGAGGERLVTLLEENGVDVTWLNKTPALQGNAVIQVTPAGENCILLFEGSNGCITEQQVKTTLAAFCEGDWLILQNEINLLPLIVDEAYRRGMHIVLNPSPYNEKLKEVDFRKLDWILVNEVEAAQIAQTAVSDPAAVFDLLHQKYPHTSVLITLGREGSAAFHVTEHGVEAHREAAATVKAVDTTAAGDTYTGYFIAGMMENRPLSFCMKKASQASALAVSRHGAAESIPMDAEVNTAMQLNAKM